MTNTPGDAEDRQSATGERVAEVERVLAQVRTWAIGRPDVRAVGLAGSWARGEQRMDSDVDIVVLTAVPEHFASTTAWIHDVVAQDAEVVRTQGWGDLIERRIVLPSGLEVEFGFVAAAWAAEPVDAGTRRVVLDGFQPLYDPENLLARLVAAVRAG
jgi:predicted nucleotidyltransferase